MSAPIGYPIPIGFPVAILGLDAGVSEASTDPYAGVWPAPALDLDYLIEVDILPAAPATEAVTYYFASRTVVGLPTDAAAHRVYEGRVVQPFRGRRSVIGQAAVVEPGTIGGGSIDFEIGDAGFDTLLTTGSFDGRDVTVKAIMRGAGLDSAITIWKGIVTSIVYDRRRVTFDVEARDRELTKQLQTARYAGTGGAEGGEDLEDQVKPAAFGYVWNATPIYLGIIGGKESYQVSGGAALPINDVPAFYDRGVELTKVAGTPTSGQYAIDTATGIVTIGGTRPDLPTCDIEGYAPGGTFHTNAADIVTAILEDFTSVTNTRIDYSQLATLRSDQGADVGLWVPGAATADDAISALLRSVAAWGGFNRTDKFGAGQLKAAGGVIRARLNETSIEDLARLRGPAPIDPASASVSVLWKRNETVTSDIASGAAEGVASFAQRQYREVRAVSATATARHALAKDHAVAGLYASQAAASAEATRLAALYESAAIWRVATRNIAPELDIGQTVEISFDRFGLSESLGVILSIDLDLARRSSILEVMV